MLEKTTGGKKAPNRKSKRKRQRAPGARRANERAAASKASAAGVGDLLVEAWRDVKAGAESLAPRKRPARKAAKTAAKPPINAAIAKRAAIATTPSKSRALVVANPAPAPNRVAQRLHWALNATGLALALGAVAGFAALYVAYFVIAPTPPDEADLWAVNRLPAVVVLDQSGEELAARGARYGEAVRVDELPPYLVRAFLSTEDRRFYTHHGVDLRGIARALVANIRSGGIAEGGSTITQQLAKNLFLSPEQSYSRKAKEALLAIWLEGRYSKDEILSVYLNRIYMGAGAYGVESAAQTYFDKSARDVTLSEAAMLAGLPQAPSALAPTQNPFGAQDRAMEVLENLRETGQVTELEARDARAAPPIIVSSDRDKEIGYFFDYVAEKARVLAGPDAVDIVVTTTLSAQAQRAAEAAVAGAMTADADAVGATQAALIAFDNKTGAVRAMVGGRSYVESQFNRATQAKRQPGSVFKPMVYAAAFENGYEPTSRVVDQPLDIAGWRPRNYKNEFEGPMRLTQAMAESVNTVAVQVSEDVGRDKVIEMARRLGVASPIPEAEAGIALGGFNATLEELTAAYLPFANGGAAPEPYAIQRIEDGQGRVLYTRASNKPTARISPKVARSMTHMLYQVVSSGTGRSAALGRRPAVGKTGTTNDWRDAWFIGYTAQLTAGVWVGDDDYQPMKKVTGGGLPAKIWNAFMVSAHEGAPRARLPGAYLAATYADEPQLLLFYDDVASGLSRVRRDGRARRYYRSQR